MKEYISTFINIKKLMVFSDANLSKKLKFTLLIIIIASIFDLVALSSIVPFFLMISESNNVENNELYLYVSNYYEFESVNVYIITFGFISLFILILSTILKSISSFLQIRTGLYFEANLSTSLLDLILNSKYDWFSSKSKSELIKEVNSECGEVVRSSFLPLIFSLSNFIMCTLIFLALVLYDPIVTIVLIFGFTMIFILLSVLTKPYLIESGNKRYSANENKFNLVKESLDGWIVLNIHRITSNFIDRYLFSARSYAKHHSRAQLIGQIPRYCLELLIFGMFIVVALYFILIDIDDSSLLSAIAVYGIAGYRILPAINLLYVNTTAMKFGSVSLLNLLDKFREIDLNKSNKKQNFAVFESNNTLVMQNIRYKYKNAKENVFFNLNFQIKNNESVAVFGPSGSGKSTLIELILGLRKPEVGNIYLNNENVFKPINASKVGYVPQVVNVFNASLIYNITLNNLNTDEDIKKVLELLHDVDLFDCFKNNMNDSLTTVIGEEGNSLSGGQKQRLGIARALFANPNILILDEPTSAQDDISQHVIIKLLQKIKPYTSILLITHRKETAVFCDRSYYLKSGDLIEYKKELHDV